MKTIINSPKTKTKLEKRAEKKYIKKCWNCGTKYIYQLEDLRYGYESNYVICPCCKSDNCIFIKRRYRGNYGLQENK